MGQKSSCLAHKHSAPRTASAERHRQTENGTAQGLQDIARRSKLEARGMPGEFPANGRMSSNSSKHAAEQNGNAVGENGSTEGLKTTSTEHVDTETSIAPHVVQEVIKPHIHEIRQEEIHRDIHVHTHHTIIQPVYDLETLPPRHFVPDKSGNLVEVNESDLPACTGQNAQWHIAAGPFPTNLDSQRHALGDAAFAANTGSDMSRGSEHDSDSVSLTDSVRENDGQDRQNEKTILNNQSTANSTGKRRQNKEKLTIAESINASPSNSGCCKVDRNKVAL